MGVTNPIIELDQEEFLEFIRAKIKEAGYDRTINAVQFSFVDRHARESLVLDVPKWVTIVLSNVLEEKPTTTIYKLVPPPTPEQTKEHIIELIKQSSHFTNEHARKAAIDLVIQDKYEILPGGEIKIYSNVE